MINSVSSLFLTRSFLGMVGHLNSLKYLFIYWVIDCHTGAWTQSLHLKPSHQPYFYEGFFKIGFCELFARSGFEPEILLISASRVARITGMSQQHSANPDNYLQNYVSCKISFL
jgi:hypothetical protein